MAVAGAVLALAMASTGAKACAALAGHAIEGGTVVSATAVSGRPDAPPYCRVVLEQRPTPASRIGTEVWLPLGGWSGRYVQLGTGGFAGTIPEAGMAAEVKRGNAVAVTDSGHRGVDGFDAGWALNAPERVVDYGYRSLGVSAPAAKAVTARFYGAAPRYSYFVGCSNGGRQALMAAQRFPDQWDGVLAGSPAVRWTAQFASFARIQQALRRPGGMIPLAKLPDIQRAARAACGERQACHFDPEHLGLTPPQTAALRLIVRDFDPRWAATPGGWDQWIVNPDRTAQSQLTFAEQFFGAFVIGRKDWRVEALSEADLQRAHALAPILDPSPDLAAFARRGGKLIMYAGGADPVISPNSAVEFYGALGRQDFARLFVIPGMLHCQGGLAPNAFGQAPVAPAAAATPRLDVRRALELWVEAGQGPPAELEAVRYRDDEPARGVAERRMIRAYGQ